MAMTIGVSVDSELTDIKNKDFGYSINLEQLPDYEDRVAHLVAQKAIIV